MVSKTSANILVFNSKGELALQLRAAQDDSYPSHWDFSAAGGIDEGEEPEQAAVRELKEELGVDLQVAFVAEHMCVFPVWGTDEPKEDYVYLYKTIYDGNFSPNLEEVQEIKFFSLHEIEEMLQSGQKFHPEFKILWDMGVISKAIKKHD